MKQENPLQGLQLEQLLSDISEYYTWEVLSETLNIERFLFHTGFKSTAKFLRKNEWAREKVENFYLYQFKSRPWPDDKQLSLAPRNRKIASIEQESAPIDITPESYYLFEHASALRKHPKKVVEQIEPTYDPSNPWNR
ncbi:MAG TPA: DNA-binding protein VF530 [Psychromonas hadalis]|nr:DNA-binding protein VF530 [Psychromonas hadalis]